MDWTLVVTGVAAAIATIVLFWILVRGYLESKGESAGICPVVRSICR